MLTFKHYTVAVHDLDQAISDYEKRFGMAKATCAGAVVGSSMILPMSLIGDSCTVLPFSTTSVIRRRPVKRSCLLKVGRSMGQGRKKGDEPLAW